MTTAATPLKLLCNLTIVVAFGTAADELATTPPATAFGAGGGFGARSVRGELDVAELVVVCPAGPDRGTLGRATHPPVLLPREAVA